MTRALVAPCALLACAVLQASADAQPSPVVDRTFVCTPSAFGGLRELDLHIWPSQKTALGGTVGAFLIVGSGSFSQRLVYVAERPGRVELERAGVYAHARRCREARRPIPLSAAGLGGPPTRWRADATCAIRGRVVVRVRASLRSPATWTRRGEYIGVPRSVASASVAVREEGTARPLAFLRIVSTTKIELWTSPRCR